MSVPGKTARRPGLRIGIIVVLVLAYGALGWYMHVMAGKDTVCTHVAYVPVVLAGMWWGRRGVGVAIVLSALILGFHLFGRGAGSLWDDVARVFFLNVVGFCVGELSERVMAVEQALRVSEGKYRLLIEKSLSAILVYRGERILFANPRWTDLLGYRPDEMVGMSIWQPFAEAEKPRVQALVAKRKAEGFTDLHYEARLVRRDGTAVWADIASSAADFEGEPAVLVNAYDITDRKEAEEKRRELADLARKQEEQLIHSTRLAELGEMAAAVAHELNQPLTGIRNFARNAYFMLEENAGSPDEVKENLRLISEQVDRAARIINQMREITRKGEHQLAPVDINDTLRDSVEFLMPQLRLSGVEVTLDLANGLPEILGDRIRLEQVFLNLLTNARQAMEEALTRRLTVRTLFEAGSDCPIVAEVRDTGKGFPPEDARKLFTPFFSTKKPGHGTGLGLSISLRIIRDHGGAITAAGEPGKGATFTVRLPLPPEAGAQPMMRDL